MDELIAKAPELGEILKAAGADDAKVGVCPKSGHDLLIKTAIKTRGQFVGCSGWPECDVTYPLPQGKIEAVDEVCPVCGTAQVKVIQFRQKPITICIDPKCSTNYEPEISIGACKTCAEAGRVGDLTVRRGATRKRYVRCTNYEECGVSYPLPQRGGSHRDRRDLRSVRRPDGGRGHGPRALAHLRRSQLPGEGREGQGGSGKDGQGSLGEAQATQADGRVVAAGSPTGRERRFTHVTRVGERQ